MSKDKYRYLKTFQISEFIKNSNHSEYRILIFGNFGVMNMGDEAILSAELEDLNKLKGATIQVVSKYPAEIKKLHNLNGIPLLNFRITLGAILKSNIIIIGGGGLFCRNKNGFKGFLFQIFFITIFMLLPVILKKSVLLYGVGFYKNMNILISRYSILVMKFCDLIAVRDFTSFEALSVENLSVKLIKDNSFLMKIKSSKLSKDKINSQLLKNSKKNVGIVLKRPSDMNNEIRLTNVIRKLIKENSQKYNFYFFSLDSNKGMDNDLIYNMEIINKVSGIAKNTRSVKLIDNGLLPSDFFSIFKRMDYIISMRFHSMLFSYRFRKPFYAISYDEKCSSFLFSIDKDFVEEQSVNYDSILEELKFKA